MELKAVIESRRSIRKFKTDPVPEAYIHELLEAARLAPSGGNIQPWRFVVIKSPEARAQLSDLTLEFVARAPVVIACCTDMSALKAQAARYKELRDSGAFEGVTMSLSRALPKTSREMGEEQTRGYLHQNTAIAVEHMVLRAVDLGLGCCWVMMFDRAELAARLELPENIRPFCLVPIGYPDQKPQPRPRRDLAELIIKEI